MRSFPKRIGLVLALLASAAALDARAQANGRMVYGDGTTTPKTEAYDAATNAFLGPSNMVTQGAPVVMRSASSPARVETMVGYVTSAGVLWVYHWDGVSWTAEWNVSVGGTGTTRRFDLAYENSTGNLIVLYSGNTSGTTELHYRVWNGTVWSGELNLDVTGITGIPLWVTLDARAGTSMLGAAVADDSRKLTALVWNGSAWTGEKAAGLTTNLDDTTTSGDTEAFDLTFEAQSGDLLVVWGDRSGGNGTNGVRYSTRSVAGTWSAELTPATFLDDATNLDLSADPTSDYILFASVGSVGGDMQYGAWSGTAWVNNTANADAACVAPLAGSHVVTTGWTVSGSTVRGVIAYADSIGSAIDWVTYTPGTGFSPQTDFTPSPTVGLERQLELVPDPASPDRLMLAFADAASDLWAKRLVMDAAGAFTWSNTEGGAALTATLTGLNGEAFSYSFNGYAPSTNFTTAGTVTATASGCSAIAISAPYTDDTNGDNQLSYRYRTPSGTGTWTQDTVLAHSASPYSFSITGLQSGTEYEVEVLYIDGDSVVGTNPQIFSNLTVGANCTVPGTVVAQQTTGATPSILVTASYTVDGNANNTLSYRYRTPSGTGTWTSPASRAHSASPYSFAISGLTCGSAYDVEVTFLDADGLSGSAVQTATNVPVTNCTSAGTPTATVNSCTQITVSAPFTNDANANGTTSFERGSSGSGPWTAVCSNVTGATPRTCVSPVSESSTYYYRVTYADADAVGGTAQQVIGPFSTAACPVFTTAAGTVTAAANAASCTAISVSAPYTNDGNANNTLSYRYRTPTGTGTWVGPSVRSHSASPYAFDITTLTFNATYDVEVTYVDTDGVTGTATQTVSNIRVGATCTGAGTVTAAQVAGATPSFSVSAPYTGDSNANNTASYRTRTPSGGTYGSPTNLSHAASPYAFTLASLSCGSTYDVEFTYADSNGIGSGTAVQTVSSLLLNNCLVTGTPTATVNGCNQITASAPFTFDANTNGTVTFERGASATGPWTAACSNVGGASPRTCSDTAVLASSTYYYRVTYSDADSVSGTAQQVIGPFSTGVCTVPAVTTGTPTATVNSCVQITVSAPYTNDTDGDSRTDFQRGSSASGPWTNVCTNVAGASPRSCVSGSLTSNTAYYYRVTFTDVDGVVGTNPQVVGPFTTQDCRTNPGAVSATVNSCSQITASATFTDLDADSTTAIARGGSASGPWTTVTGCTAVTGASPRSCVDTGVSQLTSYWYRATFTDADGISGTNPIYTASSVTTPVCPASLTVSSGTGQPTGGNRTAGSVGVVVGKLALSSSGNSVSVKSISLANLGTAEAATDVQSLLLYDDANASGTVDAGESLLAVAGYSSTTAKYTFSGLSHTVTSPTTRTVLVAMNVALGARATKTFQMRVAQADVTVGEPNTVNATNFPISANTFTITANTYTEGDATPGSTKAAAAIYAPPNGGVVSSDPPAGTTGFRVQVRVDSPSAVTGVTLSTDNGVTFPTTLTRNVNHGGSTSAGIWETSVKLSPGPYILVARVVNGGGSVDTGRVQIVVNSKGTGDGNLLVRDNSSQLCVDCHAIASHSSATSSNKYGAWGMSCRQCHQPHGTTNAYLIRSTITPPAVSGPQQARAVKFSKTSGSSSSGLVADATYANPDFSGPCQVCHTRTVGKDGTPRFRNSGTYEDHYTEGADRCTDCHNHTTSFEGKVCTDCHLDASVDTDNYAFDDVAAKIANPEWTSVGHGLASTSTYASGNSGAGLDTLGASRGDHGCLYCHDDTVGHKQAANPFRLANSALPEGMNGACLVCHSSSYTGFDPDGANGAYSTVDGKNIGKSHYNNLHTVTNNGGQYCWDCHDPHGDKSASSATLWYMMQKQPVEKTVSGLPTVFANAIEFNPAAGGNSTTVPKTSNVKLDFQDYVDGGLCRNCHAAGIVQHFTKAAASTTHFVDNGSNTIDAPNDKCSDCHKHVMGFKQLECNACHDSPSSSGKHRVHNDVSHVLGSVPTTYTTLTSAATATKYGYACGKCHAATHQNALAGHSGTAADPYPVEVVYDTTTAPANPGGTFVTVYKDQVITGTDPSKNFSNTVSTTGTNGQCANLYCHSNGAPVGKATTYQNVQWGQLTAVSCTGCHSVPGVSASTAHTIHVTAYALTCQRCHLSVTTNGTSIADKRLHVDGVKDVKFDTTLSNGSGTYNDAADTCGSTYCHSNGVTAPGGGAYTPATSIAWGATRACDSCHGGTMANTTKITTGKHTQHVNNDAVLGTSFKCDRCHNTTVDAAEAISSTTNHVNGVKNVGFTNGGTYPSPPTCSNVYCHSTGQATPTFRSASWTEPAWSTVCEKCHGTAGTFGAPDYATGNSHGIAKHVGSAADCTKCHATTTTTGTTVKAGSAVHIDGVRDVAFGAAYDANGATTNYDSGTKTCSSVTCHGNGTPVWGGTVTCSSCHSANSALLGVHAKHYGTTTNATTTTATNGATTTAYQFGCGYCHPTGAANHAAGNVSANQAAQVAFSGTLGLETLSGTYTAGGSSAGTDRGFSWTAGTCGVYCHSNAAPVGGTASTKAPTWTGTLGCNGCHNTAAKTDTAVATDLSAAHGKHIQSTAGETGSYNYTCDACHSGVIRATPASPWLLGDVDLANKTLHVQGQHSITFSSTLLGKNQSAGTYNQAPAYTCGSTYCHSAGTSFTAPFGGVTSLAWTGTTTCASCHGTTGTGGAPAYVNGTPKANAHDAHSGYTCQTCHSGVVTGSTTIAGPSLHVNGAYNVAAASGQFTVSVQGTATTPTTCASITCHGGNTASWNGTLTCRNCHDSASGETNDLGATFWSNGVTATINAAEWLYGGHGKTTGTYDVTGNPAAAFPTAPKAGSSECLYCHDESVSHSVATNPFRLRGAAASNGVTAAFSTAAPNAPCLNCHNSAASYGVTPTGQTNKKGTKFTDSAHDGAKHTVATLGGKFCWDCHDPHGERPSATNSAGNNIAMIGRFVRAKQDGVYGYTGASGVERSVQYYNRTAHVASDTGDATSIGKIAESVTAIGTPHVGICQACHDTTATTPFTKYWQNSGQDDPDGAAGTAAYRSGRVTTPNHNPSSHCISCHKHNAKFVGSGGGPDCRGCHGASSQGSRRPVDADFALQSHHVGNGSSMGGTLTNFDCVVCHSEGKVVAGAPNTVDTDATYHANGKIDLRNVDSTTAVFTYDKATISGVASTWNSGNANWVTQMQNNVDPFCLACHDSNGASQIANFRLDAAQTATNPFADGAITNNYDQVSRGSVVNIKDRVTATTDQDSGVRNVSPKADPPQGIFSRHAIRGQSESVYGATNANWDSTTYWTNTTLWKSTSVMACSDCHTTDGANGSAGNGHGSGSEYLLKDATGGASEGTAASGAVCYLCHKSTAYGGATHTGSGSNYIDVVTLVGQAGRVGTRGSGNIFGLACLNCHGSVNNAVNTTEEWGTIHGTSQVMRIASSSGTTKNSYRFLNSQSMRYYDPNGWTAATATCYTLGTPDTYSSCTQHSGAKGFTKPTAGQRPLSY